jgi:Zn-dependent M28 family amino/carboxypeptidase
MDSWLEKTKIALRLIYESMIAVWTLLLMPGKRFRGPLPAADDELCDLMESLRSDVRMLAEDIGPRNVSHAPEKLAIAEAFIAAEFEKAGFKVERQIYEVFGVSCANLQVEIPGTESRNEIVVVGAHYDSVPDCPAANDNASGVAATLSLARTFARSQSARTLRFVAFVNEEAPYAHTHLMGSCVYAAGCRQRGENIKAMLSLETIGYYDRRRGSQSYPSPLGLLYPSTADFIAFVGNTRYGQLVRQVVGSFRRAERFPSIGGSLPDAISHIGRSDHWSFWQEGYPALMVTDTAPFRYAHYHQASDTADKLDFESLARVVRGLRQVVIDLTGIVDPSQS